MIFLFNRPEVVPRLFDLIKVQDESVLPAFYYAIRDTLVARDMEQATRIAYGKTRYRVVTLGGQLIDLSGTILRFSLKKQFCRLHYRSSLVPQQKFVSGFYLTQEQCPVVVLGFQKDVWDPVFLLKSTLESCTEWNKNWMRY